MELIIFIVLIALLTIFIVRSIKGGKAYNSLVAVLNSQPQFTNDMSYLLADGKSMIGIDIGQRKICIVDSGLIPHILTRQDIRKVEILVDNRHILTGSFLKQWGKFILVDKITGNSELAEMESKRTEEFIDKNITIQLMVATNNLQHPNHYLPFLINGSVQQKKSVIKDVHDWATKIEAL